MKKLIALILSALMITMLSACNNQTDTPDSTTTKGEAESTTEGEAETSDLEGDLVFWGHTQDTWEASYKAIGDAFMEANPNVSMTFDFFPYEECQAKYETSLLAGSGGADIYEMWGGWILGLPEAGALEPMPEEMKNYILEETYPATYGTMMYDNNIYGYPLEFNIEYGGMLVNLSLMNEHGLSIPTTWDELISQAKEAAVWNGDVLEVAGFDFVHNDGLTFLFTSLILSAGGEYQNEDGTFNFSSAEGQDAFKLLTDLVIVDKVADLSSLAGGDALDPYEKLYAGRTLYVMQGPWVVSEGIQSFELEYDKDFTYTTMPPYGGVEVQKFPADTGWSLAVNADSKSKEAALEFVSYFTQEDILLQHNINAAQIPPVKTVANDPDLLKAMPYLAPAVDILDKGIAIGQFNSDILKESVNDVFINYVNGVHGSVEEAMTELDSTLNSLING